MTLLPLYYNIRNVRVRWRVTLLTVSGIAMVVFVFTVLMSMSAGFTTALRSTGRLENAMIVRRGSTSELTSVVELDERKRIQDDVRVALGPDGRPWASWEWVMVVALPRKSDGRRTSVTLRGVSPNAFEIRGDVRIIQGRRFEPGRDEVIVGRKIMERIRGLECDSALTYRHVPLRIVGVFESEGAAFESEIWGDFNTLGALFHRGPASSSLIVRMKDPSQIPALDTWIQSRPSMQQLRALPERQYYEDQAGPTALLLKGLAALVAFTMSIGAAFGTMNTMYGIVATRTREIGTLRALGFSRLAILLSFVAESAALALVGGCLGCLLALPMHGFATATALTQSFSEIAFTFRITPGIIARALVFALMMGIAGALLPAARAARLPVAGALHEA